MTSGLAIDPAEPRIVAHNREAREILAAWKEGRRPPRVPLLMPMGAFHHGLVHDRGGVDYQKYYTDPDEMVRVQREAARLALELPIADTVVGELPEHWSVGVDFWPVPSPGWIGCELLIRPHAVIAHKPMGLSREACDAYAMPDPRRGNFLSTIVRFHAALESRCRSGLRFLNRPVVFQPGGVAHYGVLAMALDLRGHEFFMDLIEEPEWSKAFLLKMAQWCDALNTTWAQPGDRGYFNNTDHGIDQLSAGMYEEFVVPVILEMNRIKGTGLPTGIHHCGRGTHLFPIIAKHFPVQRIDDLNFPTVDIAAVRAVVGDQVRITCEIDAGIIHVGPEERIRRTVADLLVPAVKDRGRFALSVGDLVPGTPLAHRLALYEAVKEFGRFS